METILSLVGGSLLLVAIPFGVLLAVVVPVWALIDLLRRDDDATTRVLWGLAIVCCLGGFGAVLYALFAARSLALRRTAFVGLLGVPLLAIVGAASLGGAEHLKETRSEAEVAASGASSDVAPSLPGVEPSRVGSVVASRPSDWARGYQVGEFDLTGPTESSLRAVDVECDWVALDTRREQHYCLSWRGLTAIDFERELTTKLSDADHENFSHLAGIAYDEPRDRILVTANTGAGGFLFAYAPSTGRWERFGELGRHAKALAVASGEEALFLLPDDPSSSPVSRILRFNMRAAMVGEIPLDPPLPRSTTAGGHEGEIQMIWSNGWLVLVMVRKPEAGGPPLPVEIYAVDPESGKVYDAGPDLS